MASRERQWDRGFYDGAISALKVLHGGGEYRDVVKALRITDEQLDAEDLPRIERPAPPPAAGGE